MSKKILIAIDKFKGSLTSLEAAQAIECGIKREDTVFNIVPIADGGDGSADVIKYVVPAVEEIKTKAVNPLGCEIETSFLLYWGSAPNPAALMSPCYNYSGKAAFIEMAKVSGLALIGENERNPMITTTYGLGQLVKEAWRHGAREITLSIGGSATNDGGTGMLQALGFRFFNKKGELITDYMCGGLLSQIGRIEAPADLDFHDVCKDEGKLSGRIHEKCRINVVCDVTNPLLGANGATYVYGPQKGADENMLALLEAGMGNLVEAANALYGREDIIDSEDNYLQLTPGAGAAGGVGYAVLKFLNGNLISGWRFFAGITNLEELVASANLVISGEGCIDSQSFSGKVIDGIATLCRKYNKELLLFCGVNELPTGSGELPSDIKLQIFDIKSIEPDRLKSMQNAAALLEQLACQSCAHIMS